MAPSLKAALPETLGIVFKLLGGSECITVHDVVLDYEWESLRIASTSFSFTNTALWEIDE